MIKLTAHAAERLEEQGISLAWVEVVLAAPERIQVNPDDPTLTRAWHAIPEFGGRMLRVVHRPDEADVLVTTAHWDRGAGAMMRTSYDPEADAFMVRFAPKGTAIERTEEVAPGVRLDFDSKGQVIGIEVLEHFQSDCP